MPPNKEVTSKKAASAAGSAPEQKKRNPADITTMSERTIAALEGEVAALKLICGFLAQMAADAAARNRPSTDYQFLKDQAVEFFQNTRGRADSASVMDRIEISGIDQVQFLKAHGDTLASFEKALRNLSENRPPPGIR